MGQGWIIKWIEQYPGTEPRGMTTYTWVPSGWTAKQVAEHHRDRLPRCIKIEWLKSATDNEILKDESWNVKGAK